MTQPNVVFYRYTLHNKAGRVIETSGAGRKGYIETLGQVLPPLEHALRGCAPGTKKSVNLTPDQGYGAYKDNLVLEVDRKKFKQLPKLDQEISVKTPSGSLRKMRVVDTKDDAVVLDGNHPLAGEELFYDIEVLERRPATEKEMSSGKPDPDGE